MIEMESQPHPQTEDAPARRGIWKRGLYMLVFVIFFAIAETLLGAIALVQFLWAVFTGGPNAALREFGADLGTWMRDVARFQSFETDDRPFPWTDWPGKTRT